MRFNASNVADCDVCGRLFCFGVSDPCGFRAGRSQRNWGCVGRPVPTDLSPDEVSTARQDGDDADDRSTRLDAWQALVRRHALATGGEGTHGADAATSSTGVTNADPTPSAPEEVSAFLERCAGLRASGKQYKDRYVEHCVAVHRVHVVSEWMEENSSYWTTKNEVTHYQVYVTSTLMAKGMLDTGCARAMCVGHTGIANSNTN